MLRLRDISIKRKLMLIIMVASTFAVLLVSAGFVAYELFTHKKAMTRDLSTLAEVIGNQSAASLIYDDKDTAEEVLSSLSARNHITRAGLYRDGKLFATFASDEGSRNPFPALPASRGPRFFDDRLDLYHDIRLDGELVGTLFLSSDLEAMNQRLRQYASIALSMFLGSICVTFLLSHILQRSISGPIFHLVDKARDVSARRNYGVRAEKQGNDELGQLIDSFNEMLGQIQQRDAALQNSNEQLEKRVQERTKSLVDEIAERRRAETAIQEQLNRISLLNQITHVISERQDLESILQVVLRQLEDHFGLELGGVALYGGQTRTLHWSAIRLSNPALVNKLELPAGTVQQIADAGLQDCETGRTVYCPDTVKRPNELNEKLAGAGFRSMVAVPLLVDQKLFGVLLAVRLKHSGFSSGERDFLMMLSEHVALAAHQATLHKQLEGAYNELRQTQQTVMQQERLKALGQMASGIAHDVNNALSPVVGFADLILSGDHGLTETAKKYLRYIRTAGEDVAHIVARLREFYRKRDETDVLQEINLNKVVKQVVEMTRPRWRDIPQSRGVTVTMKTELAADTPDMLGIESELREALTNLVLNAVDAMPDGGEIVIRARTDWPRVSVEGENPAVVILEVTDTGTGMDEETRRRCLEPFFSTKGQRGTGMGLSMVYGVVDRHEGRVEVDSELGAGTTFRFILPVRRPECAGRETESASEEILPLRVLCIDDEPLLRELIKEMLEHDGHEAELCDGGKSGVDAFRLAREHGRPFDVVITDLGMPYVDGRQVARILKLESPETPVVMLTGWGTFLKEESDPQVDVDGVLSKPPRARELRRILSSLTSRREVLAV